MSSPDSNPNQITVHTGSRLHFGLFSSPGPSGKFFQGAGIMIDTPGFSVSARQSDSINDEIQISDSNHSEIEQRVRKVVDRFRDLKNSSQAFEIQVLSSIPMHNGLGGGTQLALAIAFGLSKLTNMEIRSPEELAHLAGRGKRSSIGTFGFFQGGFLIDAGKVTPEDFGYCEFQRSIPDNWRILLVTPNEQHGLAGSAEIEAFKKLPPLDNDTADQLSSLLNKNLLQAVENSDLKSFQNSVHEFGQLVGKQFSSVQHGVYATAFVKEIADQLIDRGIGGVGQTSWGPTLFGFFDSSKEETILKKLQTISGIERCTIRVAKPMNSGLQFTHE